MRFIAENPDDFTKAWAKFSAIVKEYLGRDAKQPKDFSKVPVATQLTFDYGTDGDNVSVVNWDHFKTVLDSFSSVLRKEEVAK
ncbi:MAG: hypothetical protein PUF37_00785 [Prevotellaceae bacterium]|nr:hypothetical protein [Prevotellaceae bacterium]